jgi:hypothetical protein
MARLSAKACAAYLGLGVALVVAGTGNVQAQGTRTLATFLTSCNSDVTQCKYNLHDYTLAAADQGMICMPKGLSINDAISQELDWLRNVGAQKSDLYTGNVEDAEWAAMSTLWPCKSE